MFYQSRNVKNINVFLVMFWKRLKRLIIKHKFKSGCVMKYKCQVESVDVKSDKLNKEPQN